MSEHVPALPDSPAVPEAGGRAPLTQPQPAWAQVPPEPDRVRDWGRYVSAMLRRKWLILLAVGMGTSAGVVGSRFIDLDYMAEASIWIESAAARDASGGPIGSVQLLENYAWVELLRTYTVLDYAVEELKLYLSVASRDDDGLFESFALTGGPLATGDYVLEVDPSGSRVRLRSAEGILVDNGVPGDTLGSRLGFVWAPPPTGLRAGQQVGFSVTMPRDAARDLMNRLDTRMDLSGNFLRMELHGKNPELITETVNAVVDRHVELAAELKKEKLIQKADILETQLRAAELALRAADDALERFRVNTITLPSERTGPVAGGLEQTRDPVFDRFFQLRIDRDALGRERTEIERVLEAAGDSGLSTDALDVLATVQSSSELTRTLQELTDLQAELRAYQLKYTDEHQLVIQAMANVRELEVNTIPALLRDLVVELRSREEVLDRRLAGASEELREIPPRMINEARLRREQTVAENLYTMLQSRYEEARLEDASYVPDLRVLDRAVVPRRPLSNQRPRLIMMGFAAGLGLGLVGAVLLDRLDRRVRYPDQITTELGLNLLGIVPRLKGGGNGGAGADSAAVVEALRGVRLNLVHAYGTAGPLVLTVTSPGPGDGKSFVSANLALAFAEAGHRTVLIDGDARRGSLHRVLNQARKPGLTDLLSGSVSQDEATQESGFPSLYFVGCGTRTPDAPELMGSAAMTQLMTSLRSHYSVIIVDSPPLGAGVDAFALGTVTGNMVMVLRLGATDRELAEAKLDILDRLPIRILGAILNDVREGTAYRHYRYYSYYLPGYEHEDEGGKKERALIGGTKS
ncbi:MAG: polysaccharide biosynthesis tyrosine autokinase [Gemmatimonadota bacterium]|nr:MAG: polysaccharide biosynthesis tyrosine autokinase [Gemmatimonadota bacterium]